MAAAVTREIWVVGDRFASFALLGGVRTLGSLRPELEAAAAEPGPARCQLRIGQGLSVDALTELGRRLADPQVARTFTLAGGDEALARAQPCNRALVHKKQTRNVMLSTPVALSDREFTAALRLDDACDELADHLTGHHIQGAVLAEATRQMVLAVSEAFLLPEAKRFRMRFVTRAMELSYHTYAFPLAVGLRFTIEHLRRGAAGNFAATAAIACEQNDATVAEGRFRFTALDGELVDGNEDALARQAIGAPS
jgi:hypothetical protein